jgi:two-component system, NtrC family, sensor histidine kinase HydH
MAARRLNPYLEDLSHKLLWLVVFRSALAALLVAGGAVVLLRTGQEAAAPAARVVLGVAGSLLLLSALSVAAMSRVRDWVRFTWLQLLLDVLAWTVVVYATGGPNSYFVYLLDLVVLLGAVYLGVRGAVGLGLAALALYAGLAAGLAAGWLPWPAGYEPAGPAETAAALSVRQLAPDAFSMLGVALLGAFLASRAQQISVTVRDTERARADLAARLQEIRGELDEAQRLSTLGKVAAGLAHEIRNPLGAIRGAIELLPTPPQDVEADRLRALVLREVDRINDLVGQMLTLARPQAPHKSTVLVRTLVHDVSTLAGEDRRLGHSTIAVHVAEDLSVAADPAQLRQVLWNLLKNAIQAGPPDAPVRVRAQAADGGVEIHVDDAGPGVPEEERERVFELFYSSRPYGVGIGLATCRQIVAAHGGRLGIESSDLGGASFRVWLPA